MPTIFSWVITESQTSDLRLCHQWCKNLCAKSVSENTALILKDEINYKVKLVIPYSKELLKIHDL